jgi:hypothetical protein
MAIRRRRRARRSKGTLFGVTFGQVDCGELRNRLRSFERLLARLGSTKFELLTGRYASQKEVDAAKTRIAGLERMIGSASRDRVRLMETLLTKCGRRV